MGSGAWEASRRIVEAGRDSDTACWPSCRYRQALTEHRLPLALAGSRLLAQPICSDVLWGVAATQEWVASLAEEHGLLLMLRCRALQFSTFLHWPALGCVRL